MTEPTYLTAEGAARLRAELKDLTGPKREELAARLRAAIQMGDLSENADYIKAKEDQGFLEGRIQELEYLLGNAVIIEDGRQQGCCLGRFTCHHSRRRLPGRDLSPGWTNRSGPVQRDDLTRVSHR